MIGNILCWISESNFKIDRMNTVFEAVITVKLFNILLVDKPHQC
jgi:hypothetical protein